MLLSEVLAPNKGLNMLITTFEHFEDYYPLLTQPSTVHYVLHVCII